MGIIGGLVTTYLFQNRSDINYYTFQSLVEYDNLIHNPKIFFTDSLPNVYKNGLGGFFSSTNSFWNDLRNNILLKTMGVFNIFSRGNYYINSLFFNFITFFGHIALFRIYKSVYPAQKNSIIIGCFFLPSFIFYTSIIGKDMLVFTALSIFCYSIYFGMKEVFSKKRIAYLILSFCFILLMRNFVAAILLPCTIAWYVYVRYNIKRVKFYASLIALSILIILTIHFLPNKYNPLNIVVDKQQSFFALGKAGSQYQNDTLQSNLTSFVTAAPKALRHSFLSPYPAEFDNIYLNGFALEIFIFLMLLILHTIYPKKNKKNSFVLFSIVFTILFFLFAGYITTNAGSLVRYRSIYFPFLIVPILCSTNWVKIKNYFTNN